MKKNPSSGLTRRQQSARIKNDAAAKARALKKYGLAEFRGSIAAANMTPRKIARINKIFDSAQKNAIYKGGMAHRMFYRPDPKKPYVLNSDYFRFLESKYPAPNQPNIIKTSKGNIVGTTDRNARIIGVTKDGTIIINQAGQDVYTGRMTDKQLLDFLRDVDSGKFKFPNNFRIGITYFQNDTGEVSVSNLRQLQKELRRYAEKIKEAAHAHYPNFEPLKLTYYRLSERETRLNEQRERERIAQQKRRVKARKQKGESKNRRYRSRD